MVLTQALPKFHAIALGGAVLVLSLLGTYLYQKRRKERIPEIWEPVGTVTKLRIYPLKSGRRKSLKALECTKVGPKQTKEEEKAYQLRDRELIVYGEKDLEFRTARTYPKMALIEVNVHDENYFSFDAPNMRALYVKIPKAGDGAINFVKCWFDERIRTLDCGDEAASWFSRYIFEKDSGLRLGYFEGQHKRNIEKAHAKYLKFYKNLKNEYSGLYSDMATVHIINESTVEDLNSRIENGNVTHNNFRPNIVVKSEKYAEDDWEWVKIGDVIFRKTKPCTRCIFTTINPESGIRDLKGEPLKTLKSYHGIENEELRKLENNSPIMGINAGVVRTGLVHVGDEVFVGK